MSATLSFLNTSALSIALRRRPDAALQQEEQAMCDAVVRSIRANSARLIGPVRQEVLTGIQTPRQFIELQHALAFVRMLPLPADAWDRAAEFHNTCRASGVAAGPDDMVVCAAAHVHGLPILAADGDFRRYADCLPIRLASP